MSESSQPSTSVLHKQWVKLENEHHQLAVEIASAGASGADLESMRKGQARTPSRNQRARGRNPGCAGDNDRGLPRLTRRRNRTRTRPRARHRVLRARRLSYDFPSVSRPGTHGARFRIQLSPAVVIVSGSVRTANGRRRLRPKGEPQAIEPNRVVELIFLARNESNHNTVLPLSLQLHWQISRKRSLTLGLSAHVSSSSSACLFQSWRVGPPLEC